MFYASGNEKADEILTALLSSSMMIGAVLGCVLDNIIPGRQIFS